MLLQDWIRSKPNLVLLGEQLVEVDRFSYLGISTSPRGRVSQELHPATDQRLGVHGIGEISIALWLRKMAAEKMRYTETFGVSTVLSL